MVLMESVVSGHKYNVIRDRLADKLEVIRFDPFSKFYYYYFWIAPIMIQFITVQKFSIYRERRRIRSM